MVTMTQAFKKFWKNYFNFTGTATRAEYWWMALWSTIFFIAWLIITTVIGVSLFIGNNSFDFSGDHWPSYFSAPIAFFVIWLVISLAALVVWMIPTLALTVRRYRDTGLNNLFVWIVFALNFVYGSSVVFDSFSSIFGIVAFVISVLPTNALTDIQVIGNRVDKR